jgi:ubiquinone/menaquinone biosynthesis C-methylase UbiE
MADRLPEKINDFDSIADVYDELVDWAPYDDWADALEKRLTRWGLTKAGWILDAACGTGLSTLPWAKKGYRVVGTDASEPMLERARKRMRRERCQVLLLRQNLLSLAPGRQFDAAICMHSGLDYLVDEADIARAFASLRGCLLDGGLLAFDKCLDVPSFYRQDCTDKRDLSCGFAEFQYHWDRRRRLMEQRCAVVRTVGTPHRTEVLYLLKASDPDELVALVEKAGFVVLEPPTPFTVEDPGMGIFRAV